MKTHLRHALPGLLFFLSAGIMYVSAGKLDKAPGLVQFLPDSTVCKWAKSEEEPKLVQGPELFQIINGGAELYIKHGYKQAIFQEYALESGRSINIDIYAMPSREKAAVLFKDKGGDKGKAVKVGDAAILEKYYCMFRQGPYLVTITDSKFTDKTAKLLMQIAEHMARKMVK